MNSKIQEFKDSWIEGFNNSRVQEFENSRIKGFKD